MEIYKASTIPLHRGHIEEFLSIHGECDAYFSFSPQIQNLVFERGKAHTITLVPKYLNYSLKGCSDVYELVTGKDAEGLLPRDFVCLIIYVAWKEGFVLYEKYAGAKREAAKRAGKDLLASLRSRRVIHEQH